jgi:N-acetylmuramoyl-L-alanine amidase
MLIAIDCGHGCAPDIGASGNGKQEDKLTLEVGNIVAKLLASRRHTQVMVRPLTASSVNDSLNRRVREANKRDADLYISIHFNAFSSPTAEGAEVFLNNANSPAKVEAARILDNLCEMGFRRRGVKYASFAVLRNTHMPAILIECCFLTNRLDMQRFDASKVALAIVDGILGDKKIISENAILTVGIATLLKPTTQQSNEINPASLTKIEPGKYQCELIAEEEGHYLIKYKDREYFIYSGHCSISVNA